VPGCVSGIRDYADSYFMGFHEHQGVSESSSSQALFTESSSGVSDKRQEFLRSARMRIINLTQTFVLQQKRFLWYIPIGTNQVGSHQESMEARELDCGQNDACRI
jgi:hypothetical protein